MDIGQIDKDISYAIVQIERAKLRLLKSLDLCYPGTVGDAKLKEIRHVTIDLAIANGEMQTALRLTMDVIEKWSKFIQDNEERYKCLT